MAVVQSISATSFFAAVGMSLWIRNAWPMMKKSSVTRASSQLKKEALLLSSPGVDGGRSPWRSKEEELAGGGEKVEDKSEPSPSLPSPSPLSLSSPPSSPSPPSPPLDSPPPAPADAEKGRRKVLLEDNVRYARAAAAAATAVGEEEREEEGGEGVEEEEKMALKERRRSEVLARLMACCSCGCSCSCFSWSSCE